MRETYLAREISNFDSYYFENYVSCLRNRPNRHDDGGIIDPLAPPLSVFNHPGKGGSKHARKRMLTEMELKSASTHVLLNCPEVQPFHSYFVGTYGKDDVYPMFSKWFREYVHNPVNVVDVVNVQFLRDISWEPYHRVRIMSKYFINGYKFHTEEWSKGKKTNNSGVWVNGEGDIDYYGMLQEIPKLDYLVGWPKKKIVIFRCKWCDPDSSGTKVHPQYKIVEINHTRQYHFYDPFIIAQNVKQVYYIPYPLCKNKSLWHVVIETKPVGRVEVEDALDVAYQNDISSVEAMVDNELAGELQHSEGIYEEFDATFLQSNPNNYREGTCRANEEQSQTDEYETSDKELLEENEISDEEEFGSHYESNEEG